MTRSFNTPDESQEIHLQTTFPSVKFLLLEEIRSKVSKVLEYAVDSLFVMTGYLFSTSLSK